MDLQTPIIQASKANKMYARRLEKLGIIKLEDFLYHVPFRYEDYSLLSKIGQIQAGETVTIRGRVEKIENKYTRQWKTLQKAKIKDETGSIDILWFNQPFLTRVIKKGDLVSLSGKVSFDKNKLTMVSPDYEVIFENQTIHTGRLVPIYPETRGVSSKWLRRQVYKLLSEKNQIKEYLPQNTIVENDLMELSEAIKKIHFPDSLEQAEKARQRLSFDELFKLQLSSLIRKKAWEKHKIKPWKIEEEKVNSFISGLPFELTNSQKNATNEIIKDLSSDFVATAWSKEDQVVEGIEHKNARIIGVQWHPEMMMEEENAQKLFKWLINEASKV